MKVTTLGAIKPQSGGEGYGSRVAMIGLISISQVWRTFGTERQCNLAEVNRGMSRTASRPICNQRRRNQGGR